jgi:hypothetical protein
LNAIFKDPGAVCLSTGRFSNSAFSPEEIERLFSFCSREVGVVRAEILRADSGTNDFTAIRKMPVIPYWWNVGTLQQCCGYLVLDPIFLFDKALTEPYWAASNSKGQKFRQFWGQIFEDYVNAILSDACKETNMRFAPNIVTQSNEQLCDGMILEGETLIILEYKSVMMTARAKYGNDPTILLAEIEAKLVKNAEGRRKGVLQLNKTVDLLFGDSRLIENVYPNWRKIKRVMPCVVTLDSIGGAIGMSSLLQLYAEKLKNVDIEVTPIFCVTITALEKRFGFFGKHSLVDIFDRWLSINPSLGTPLGQMNLSLSGWRNLPMLDVSSFFRTGIKRLFPNDE